VKSLKTMTDNQLITKLYFEDETPSLENHFKTLHEFIRE